MRKKNEIKVNCLIYYITIIPSFKLKFKTIIRQNSIIFVINKYTWILNEFFILLSKVFKILLTNIEIKKSLF